MSDGAAPTLRFAPAVALHVGQVAANAVLTASFEFDIPSAGEVAGVVAKLVSDELTEEEKRYET